MEAALDHWPRSSLRAAACQGKQKLSRDTARKIAKRQTEKGTPSHEYKCRFCGRHHIGRNW